MRETASAGITRKGMLRGALRPTLLAILLSSAMVSEPFLTRAHAESYSFSSVTVEGNTRVDAATILKYAGIARGETLQSGQLNDAYQRIFASGLFETVDLLPQGGTLLIKVKELPMLNVVDFQGNKLVKDEKLTELVKSKSRLVYNPAQAEADAAQISEAYRVQGRLAATVDPKIIRRSDNRVDLVFEITEGKVVENEGISFVGNRSFSDRRLKQVLQTKQAGFLRQLIKSDTFVPERLEVDKQMLRDFYMSRGYIDVQVVDATGQLSRERDATFVTYTVKEGQSWKIGRVSTVSEVEGVDAAEFAAVQKMRSGVTYSPSIIENNIARMENLALRKGLNFVSVEPRLIRNERGQTLDVEYVIKRGQKVFVERIDIEGNTTTLDQVVRRQFRTVEGDPFNPREIRQAAERIRALGFFTDAKVDAKPGSNPDEIVVNVDLEEKPTGSISFGASFGTTSGLGLNVGFSETNFLGRGQAFAVNISTASDTKDSGISFVEPALLGRDLKLKLGVSYNETNNASALYDTRAVGISTGLEFPISEQSRLELRYKAFQDTVKDVTSTSALLIAEGERGAEFGSGLGYSYTFDNRVTGLNPKSSLLFRFGQDFVGLGGDAKYVETTALAVAETKVFNEDVTLRAVFEGGATNSFGGYDTRVTDRYFANGKMRGFDTNGIGPRTAAGDALGGNFYATMKLEAEFPLGLPEEYGITGGVFYDMGSVWGLDSNPDGVDDSAHLRAAVGVSILWTTPIGPLRFNFSNAIKKESYDEEQSFDLTIATKF
ncbi:outer membrane protein assembly factor BamA [Cypionkella sp.]|uniref:outer membrane protein assembly factor BamA n=1 Tax=Cypionkella sp. TaxID=2811411 RepID=UPI00271D3652|nr:outer membrane protein assembly factor BamA [Cypionkella sp.]MDO8983898.1 outer membrane protein assembly factor BamA [Cypionkella sp.]MDP2049421.1 outer membrane protein assembly factor BamA [Cypionkella sp.]